MMGAQRHGARSGAWFLLLLATWWTALAVSPVSPKAWAQNDDQLAAPAAGDKTAAAQPVEPKHTQSWLSWFIRSSGLIGLFILGLSIYFVSTVSRLFYELRMVVALPPEIIGRAEDRLQQRDFKGVFDLVKEDDSFFSRVVSTGISELPNGLPEARDAMERVGEALTVEMEKRISMLAVLGTLGPMIGLLGTLLGMINSFGVIARSDVQMRASEVAAGISQALLLTFEGVGLSVPAIYFFALFRNRVQHIAVTTMLRADQFLRHFAHAARGKKAAAGPAEPALKPTSR